MTAPRHTDRTADEIVTEHIYHDPLGFGLRAASWLDLVKRTGDFAALHYACIDARLAIEHLIFEQIRITRGDAFTIQEYKSCLSQSTKLDKVLNKLVPEYEKLLTFTEVIVSLSPGVPPVNKWDIRSLMKSWGILSSYLHWRGAHTETTENLNWQRIAIQKVTQIIDPLWRKMSSAHSACMRPDSMPPSVRDVWEDFLDENIDREVARRRLEILQHLLRSRQLLV